MCIKNRAQEKVPTMEVVTAGFDAHTAAKACSMLGTSVTLVVNGQICVRVCPAF